MHAVTCINIQPESFFLIFRLRTCYLEYRVMKWIIWGRFIEDKEFWLVPISLKSAFAGHDDYLLEFGTDQKERLKT